MLRFEYLLFCICSASIWYSTLSIKIDVERYSNGDVISGLQPCPDGSDPQVSQVCQCTSAMNTFYVLSNKYGCFKAKDIDESCKLPFPGKMDQIPELTLLRLDNINWYFHDLSMIKNASCSRGFSFVEARILGDSNRRRYKATYDETTFELLIQAHDDMKGQVLRVTLTCSFRNIGCLLVKIPGSISVTVEEPYGPKPTPTSSLKVQTSVLTSDVHKTTTERLSTTRVLSRSDMSLTLNSKTLVVTQSHATATIQDLSATRARLTATIPFTSVTHVTASVLTTDSTLTRIFVAASSESASVSQRSSRTQSALPPLSISPSTFQSLASSNRAIIAKPSPNKSSVSSALAVGVGIAGSVLVLLIVILVLLLLRKRKTGAGLSRLSETNSISTTNPSSPSTPTSFATPTNAYEYAYSKNLHNKLPPRRGSTLRAAGSSFDNELPPVPAGDYTSLRLYDNRPIESYGTLQRKDKPEPLPTTTEEPIYFEAEADYDENIILDSFERRTTGEEPVYAETVPDVYAIVDKSRTGNRDID